MQVISTYPNFLNTGVMLNVWRLLFGMMKKPERLSMIDLYLKQIREYDDRIKSIKVQLKRLQIDKADYKPADYSRPVAKEKGPITDMMAETITRNLAREAKLIREYEKLSKVRNEIVDHINRLENENERKFLYDFYVLGYSMESIMARYKYDICKAINYKYDGFKHIREMLEQEKAASEEVWL